MSRPAILSSEYEYIPVTDATRAKMSAAHRKRLGIPDGFRRLFGTLVPDDENFERIRKEACAARDKGRWHNGRAFNLGTPEYAAATKTAVSFVTSDKELDFDLLGELFGEGVTASEAAEFFHISEHHAEMKIKGWRAEMRRRRKLKL